MAKSKKKKKRENKNELYWLALIFFLGMGFLIVFSTTQSNSEAHIKVEKNGFEFKIAKGEIPDRKKDLEEKEVEFEDQVSKMELLKQTISKNIKLERRVDSLITLRKNDLDTIRHFVTLFKVYNDMDKQERNDFLFNVLKFLSKENNPDIYEDYADWVDRDIKENKIKDLEQVIVGLNSEINTLKAERESLFNQLNALKKKNVSLEEKLAENIRLYGIAQAMLEEQKNIIAKLRIEIDNYKKNAALDKLIIAGLSAQIDSLEYSAKRIQNNLTSIEEEIATISKIRVNDFVFEPKGKGLNRMDKEDGYKVNKIKEIEVSFILKPNHPSKRSTTEHIYVVYHIPVKGDVSDRAFESEQRFYIVSNDHYIRVDTPFKTTIPVPSNIGKGVCKVQIFSLETTDDVPIDYEDFVIR